MGRYLGRCSAEECNRAVWDDGDGKWDYADSCGYLCSRCSYRQFRYRTAGRVESPIEARFLECWQIRYPAVPLQPNFWIDSYRVDFALPGALVVIELDGAATHTSPWDKAKDEQRQRYLEAAGWYVIRFTGSEINRDTLTCVAQAADEIIDRLQSWQRRRMPGPL